LKRLGIEKKLTIVGIAKKLEEIFFPGDSIPIYLDKRSETLKVIQHLRNEAHRFGITFHRNKRSKAAIGSELEKIKGIGNKTARDLLREFKSVKQVRKASLAQLQFVIGESKGKVVYDYFNAKN
jgi:excinuclease ABC subunit C